MPEYKRIKRELSHKGQIVDFYTDYMEINDEKVVKWDFIEHKGAAAVVAIDNDNKLIMVRQYRNALEKYTLEIPAGALNKGEDMKTCAVRELEEETGYKANKVEHLFDLYTTVAFCNEKIGIYVAYDLEQSNQNLDEDEFVTIEKYTLDELIGFIFSGEIDDSKTMAAILAYKEKYVTK